MIFKKSLFICSLLAFFNLNAQKISKLSEFKLSKNEVESHLRFLGSDEMLGRRTGEITNNVAARYVAEQFRLAGLKPANGQSDYLQMIPFENSTPSKKGEIYVGKDTLKYAKDFFMLSGQATKLENTPVVFVGYGWIDEKQNDYKDINVKGKIVVCQFGIPNSSEPFENLTGSAKKIKFAAENGALALVQLYNLTFPFASISNYMGGEKLNLAAETKTDIPHIWINNTQVKLFSKESMTNLSLNVGEVSKKPVISYNVVGVLEGSDPILKNEYVVLSAHFDHVGYGKKGGMVSKTDTIFNGTRDNAIGTTAVLMAAKHLMAQKPKRSVVFIGYTGEEVGLLGSKYYSEHPLIPLKDCVFNLNTDGAGYNDTTKVTIIGLDRTDAQTEIETAAKAFGLTATNDPAPEQGLFDRSDNVSLAAKGIPAPDFAPGFTAFDKEIGKYYHQVADQPESLNFNYVSKFCQSYIYSARLIADRKTPPKWKAGDKYEKAAQELYGK
jgi:hypothetical protein